MISSYPDGVTGAALLLMRLASALVVYPALACLGPVPDSWWLAIPSAIMVLALLAGLGMRAAGVLLVLLLAACLITARGETFLLLLSSAVAALALVLLGPGAYSIDAHRFGRRVIRLATRSPDRGGAGSPALGFRAAARRETIPPGTNERTSL